MGDYELVKLGEIRISRDSGGLICAALGSCVAVIMYDPLRRVGGVAHVMLPGAQGRGDDTKPGKYADTAVERLLLDLQKAGASRERIVCKIVGGANMFHIVRGEDGKVPRGYPASVSIGERNIRAVKKALKDLSLSLVGEDTGGCCGRTIRFELKDGSVEVVSIRRGTKII